MTARGRVPPHKRTPSGKWRSWGRLVGDEKRNLGNKGGNANRIK